VYVAIPMQNDLKHGHGHVSSSFLGAFAPLSKGFSVALKDMPKHCRTGRCRTIL